MSAIWSLLQAPFVVFLIILAAGAATVAFLDSRPPKTPSQEDS